jgi:hypothetical protein
VALYIGITRIYSRTWHLETQDMDTWLGREHHFGEKAARLIKYVDLIGYIGIFGSALETENSISIHIRVSSCRFHCIFIWQLSFQIYYPIVCRDLIVFGRKKTCLTFKG